MALLQCLRARSADQDFKQVAIFNRVCSALQELHDMLHPFLVSLVRLEAHRVQTKAHAFHVPNPKFSWAHFRTLFVYPVLLVSMLWKAFVRCAQLLCFVVTPCLIVLLVLKVHNPPQISRTAFPVLPIP